MSLLGFHAKNHPNQVAGRGADDEVDDRATPADLFALLHRRFEFTVDVAASPANTKLLRFYDRAANGLEQPWTDERVWCNPPFSAIRPWVEKAWEETAALVVMLLPADRTEQSWWQELVEPYRDRAGSPVTVEFLAGRLRFLRPGQEVVGANERPPFGCCLVIWQRARPAQGRLLLEAGSARSSARGRKT